MTEKYQELKALLDSAEARKQEAMTRAGELRAEITKLEQDYETAVVTGKPTRDITRELRGLRDDLSDVEQEALILRVPENTQAKMYRRDPRIAKLANDVLQDNAQHINALREAFQRVVKSLQEIKADYLRRVAEAGALNKEASALSKEQNSVKKYVPGEEAVFFSAGMSGGGRMAGPDEIYIDNTEIDKVFKDGDFNEKH